MPKDNRSANSRKAFVDERSKCSTNASARFTSQDNSTLHIAASDGFLNFERPNICAKISTAMDQEIHKARVVLDTIFSTATLLARQGLALRGDQRDGNSNFIQFLKTRAVDIPELKEWLLLQGSEKKTSS